jgi:hypothetical protein
MEATVTNLSSARHLTALFLISFQIFTAQSASAQFRLAPPTGAEVFYVQAPASTSANTVILQPVITPPQLLDSQLGQIGHLWPRMTSYTLETEAVEPFVQPDMSLGLQYNYSFTFDLTARNSQGKAIAIPEGWYQLQIAVVRKSRGNIDGVTENPYERYVTSTSTFVKVANNSFGRKISLRFSRLEDTAAEHHLYIELIPLKEECQENTAAGERKFPCITEKNGKPDPLNSILEPNPNFKTYMMEMPFIAYQPLPAKVRDADDLNDQPLPYIENSLTLYIVKAQAYRARHKRAFQPQTATQHAQDERLPLVNSTDKNFESVKPLLDQLLNARAIGTLKIDSSYAPLLAALCTELALRNKTTAKILQPGGRFASLESKARNAQIRLCTQRPEKYLRITRITHLGKPVTEQVKRILQRPLAYTVSANYMANRSSSLDSYNTFNFKIPYVSKLLDQIGFGYTHTVNLGNSRSHSANGISSMSVLMDFNYMALAIPVLGSQTCLDIRAIDRSLGWIYDVSANSNNGIYLCAPATEQKIVVNEVYAHAFERCRITTMMGCDSLSQSVNIPMRGDRDISQFFYEVRKGVTPDHNNLVSVFGDMASAAPYFNNTPTTGQMQVITPIEFPQEKVPSFFDLVTDVTRSEKF